MPMDHVRVEWLREERRLTRHVTRLRADAAAADDDLDPGVVLSDVAGEREPVGIAASPLSAS
jgi:hypothetical protein